MCSRIPTSPSSFIVEIYLREHGMRLRLRRPGTCSAHRLCSMPIWERLWARSTQSAETPRRFRSGDLFEGTRDAAEAAQARHLQRAPVVLDANLGAVMGALDAVSRNS